MTNYNIAVDALEEAAKFRLFEKAAAAENINLADMSETDVEDLYSAYNKTHEVNTMNDQLIDLFEKQAAYEGVDLDSLSDDELAYVYNNFLENLAEEEEGYNDDEEAYEKLAEAEILGRHMARAYMDELEKEAAVAPGALDYAGTNRSGRDAAYYASLNKNNLKRETAKETAARKKGAPQGYKKDIAVARELGESGPSTFSPLSKKETAKRQAKKYTGTGKSMFSGLNKDVTVEMDNMGNEKYFIGKGKNKKEILDTDKDFLDKVYKRVSNKGMTVAEQRKGTAARTAALKNKFSMGDKLMFRGKRMLGDAGKFISKHKVPLALGAGATALGAGAGYMSKEAGMFDESMFLEAAFQRAEDILLNLGVNPYEVEGELHKEASYWDDEDVTYNPYADIDDVIDALAFDIIESAGYDIY